MNEQSERHQELPLTAALDQTLRRARSDAGQRSHCYVTLEHLLLALLGDPDAAKLFRSCGADTAAIESAVLDALGHRMASLAAPDGRTPTFSYRFDPLFVRANEVAAELGRREIDGALALIALAKDAESKASAILISKGFTCDAALAALRTPANPKWPQAPGEFPGHSRQAANPGMTNAPLASKVTPKADGGNAVNDMIESVRKILKAEEERDLAQRGLSVQPAEGPKRLGNDKVVAPKSARGAVLTQAELRPEQLPKVAGGGLRSENRAPKLHREPRLGPLPAAARVPPEAPRSNGFSEPAAPAFDLEAPPKIEKRAAPPRPYRRNKSSAALLAKIFDGVPRQVRTGVSETVQVSLSKDEAALIFGRILRRDPRSAAAGDTAFRAITIRLTAPEGGFFIEALTPETQWLSDHPREDKAASWAWTVIPGTTGASCLKASISVQDVDVSGPAAAIALPDQVIKVRVRSNMRLVFGHVMRAGLWMLLGGSLTAAALYVLKIAGKLH